MKRFALILLLSLFALSSCRKPVQLVLGTYNLHHCEPAEGGGRCYDSLATVLRQMAPDVVALQELDSCNARSAAFQADTLAKLCGMDYLYHRTIPFGDGSYGIGMLYKPGLNLVNTTFIPLPGEEPRGAIVAEFERFVYVCTHFCHQSADNRTQSMDILGALLTALYYKSDKPVFVAGDFNATYVLEKNSSWEPFSSNEPTFSTPGTSARIEYILHLSATGNAKLLHSGTLSEAAGLSDHLPVFSTIRIR